jgi:hypothetical protein
MKNFITLMFVAFLFIASGCGDNGKEACEAEDATVDVKKAIEKDKDDKKYLCYVGCLEAEASKIDCKKACYGEKKVEKDVVDSPDDVTVTDAASTPEDVSKTNG